MINVDSCVVLRNREMTSSNFPSDEYKKAISQVD